MLQAFFAQNVFINGILHLCCLRVYQQGATAPEDEIRSRGIVHALLVHLFLQVGVIVSATELGHLDHQFSNGLVIRPDPAGRTHRVDFQLGHSLNRPIFIRIKSLWGHFYLYPVPEPETLPWRRRAPRGR